jgi:hypothetical protein
MLYLQADHLFYENMGSEEACIEAMTRHVQRVNSIYNPIGNLLLYLIELCIPCNLKFNLFRHLLNV